MLRAAIPQALQASLRSARKQSYLQRWDFSRNPNRSRNHFNDKQKKNNQKCTNGPGPCHAGGCSPAARFLGRLGSFKSYPDPAIGPMLSCFLHQPP